MRPRYLEIEGLQSFKNLQKLDFDVLGETGLFGIFGPTGSGKSTVLDAITLALYGNVLRAARGTQGIINTDSNIVRVSFTFDLLKQKEITTYRVERVYRRKKESENSAEIKIARLFEVEEDKDTIIADRPVDVNRKIEELVGLQLDDFTRSVVLPQNKFQEFLFLEKAKKREMLERIFYLEEYGRHLTEKVSRNISKVRFKLSGIEGAISALGDISEKTLIETGKNLQNALEQRKSVDNELKQMETIFNESKEVWELVSELDIVIKREQEHLKSLDEINTKKNIYENSVRAAGMIDIIGSYRQVMQKLNDTCKRLDEINDKMPCISTELHEGKQKYDKSRDEAEKDKPLLIEQKSKLMDALQVKNEILAIESRLKTLREEYSSLREKMQLKDREITDKKTELDEVEKREQEYRTQIENLKVDIDYRNDIQKGVKLEDDVNTARRDKEVYQLKYEELALKISNLEKNLAGITDQRQALQKKADEIADEQSKHENTKPGDRNKILKDIDDYHRLKSAVDALKFKKADIDNISERLNIILLQIKKQKEDLEKAFYNNEQLKVRFEELKSIEEKLQKQYEKNFAYILARNLVEGEGCPVCGSKHHPGPAVQLEQEEIGDIEERLTVIRRQIAEAEKQYRESENECIKLQEKLKNMQIQETQITGDIEERKLGYKSVLQTLPLYMQEMKLSDVELELNDLASANSKKIKEVDEWENKHEEIKKDILKQNEILSAQILEENRKKAEFEVNKEHLGQIEKNLKECDSNLTSKLNLYTAFLNRLKIDNVHNELKQIEENDRKVEKLQKQTEQLQQMQKSIRRLIEQMLDERHQLDSRFVDVDAEGRSLKEQKLEKERKIDVLAGNRNIESEIKFIEERLTYLVQWEKEALDNVKRLEQQFNNLNIEKNTLENQKDIYNRTMESETLRLQQALEERGFKSVEDAEKCLISTAHRDELEKEIKEFERVHINLKAHRDMLQKKLNNRNITEEEWIKIREEFKLKQQEKEDIISLHESAKSAFNAVKKNFEKWVQLDREYKKHSRKCEMLEQIQKLLKGNSFIEFIAEERLRYIAKEASETLGVLTKFRYALELDTDNGFIIRDNANGGVRRLVTSLSGGETFLTSLCLALALSKQIQLKGQSPLEFFFLDEGFGTLDSTLLDTVIDSLECLSTKQRVIGLISHVPELKNRISRRLIIEPPNFQGEGSRVRIEKA